MFKIQEIGKYIQRDLLNTNDKTKSIEQKEYDIIIQSFILGYVQKKNNPDQEGEFLNNLSYLKSLFHIIDTKLFNEQRLHQLFIDILSNQKNLQEAYEQLNKEMESLNIQNTTCLESQWKTSESQSTKYSSSIISDFSIIDKTQGLINQSKNQVYLQLQRQFANQIQMEVLNYKINQQDDLSIINENKNTQIECKICYEQISQNDMAPLYCSHIYHRSCLNQYCITQMKSQQYPIQCPSGCQQIIIQQELINVLTEAELNEFNSKSFKNFVESLGNEYSWCPTPDCTFAFILGENSQLDCPFCRKSYCLQCQIEYHNGFTCEEYQYKQKTQSRIKLEKYNEDKFNSYVKGTKSKQCPNCKSWVQKTQGCNHMTCKCKFQFCYLCGGIFGNCLCQKNKYWPLNFFRR